MPEVTPADHADVGILADPPEGNFPVTERWMSIAGHSPGDVRETRLAEFGVPAVVDWMGGSMPHDGSRATRTQRIAGGDGIFNESAGTCPG